MKKSFAKISVAACAAVFSFTFFLYAPPVFAEGFSDTSSNQQLASLSAALDSLRHLLSLLEKLIAPSSPAAYAQVAPPAPVITSPTSGTTVSPPVTLIWTSTTPSYYYTVWRYFGGSWNTLTQCTDLPYTTTNCTDTTASGAVNYYIGACTGPSLAGPCNTSNYANITVGSAPAAPSNLTVWWDSAVQLIKFTFTDNADNESGYKVGIKLSSDSSWPTGSTWEVGYGAKSGSGGTFQSNFSPTPPPGTYDLRVKAYNSYGDSNWLQYSGAVTVPSATPPSPSLNAIAPTTSTVSLSWNSVSGAGWYNVYRRSPAGNGTWPTTATALNISSTSYSDAVVSPGTSYEYYVVACSSTGGCSSPSNYQSVTLGISESVPSSPTGLSIGGSGTTSINIYWTDNSSNETEFRIERQFNSSTWTQVGFVGSNISTYNDTGASGAGTYAYRVIACNGSGCSGYSNTASITINVAAPATPSGLTATYNSDGGSINVSWTDNSSDEWGFRLYRRVQGSGSWFSLASTNINITSFTDTYQLTANTMYEYVVHSYHTYESTDSNIVSVTTPTSAATSSTSTSPTAPPTPPPSPTPSPTTTSTTPISPSGLTYILSQNGTQVDLAWADNSSNETRFEIYRQTQGGSWTYYAQTGTNINSYYDTPPAGSYYYQVTACNGTTINSGCSSSSNIVFVSVSGSVATSTPQPPPNAPSSLIVSIGNSNAYLTWNDNSTNELGFKLYRNANNSGWTEIGNVGTNITSYTDANLPPGTYSYHLNAYMQSNALYVYSAPSNDSTITIYAPPTPIPPAPTYVNQPYGLTANVSESNVTLAWINNSSAATYINIGRRSSGGPLWIIVGAAGGTATTYIDTNVPPGNYEYMVFACNAAGCPQQGSNWMPAAVGSPLYVDLRIDRMKGTVYRSAPSSFTVSWNTSGAYGSGCMASGNWNDIKTPKSIPSGSEYYTNVTLSPGMPNPLSFTLTCSNAKGESVSDTVNVQISTAGTVATGTIATVGAFLKGTVTDASGFPVSGVYVHAFTASFGLNFSAFTDANGAFGINLPAGTYWIEISPASPRSDLIRPAPIQISVSEGATKTISLQFNAGTKLISGAALFSNGQPVTDGEVGAYSSDIHQWVSAFVNKNGAYSLRVSGGTWQVGIRPKSSAVAQWAWTGDAFPSVTFKDDSSSETQTVNFSIPLPDAQLVVRTVDDTDAPLAAGVVVDAISAAQGIPVNADVVLPPIFQKSDLAGSAIFTLKTGTYYVRAYLPPELGYDNPDEQKVFLASGKSQNITLVFKKRVVVSTAHIRGVARLDDGTTANALLWAWSEKGDTAQLWSNENGTFDLLISAGRWHLGAGKEVNGYPYKSSELTIDVAEKQIVNIEIVLVSVGKNPLAPPVSVSQPATQQIIAQAQDGAKVVIPDGATKSSGNVNLEVKPTIEAPSQGGAKVVSTVYDIRIKDPSGAEITSLQKKIEINIPYDPEELKAQGISESNIVPSYYDESTGAWIKADDYTIDRERQVAIVRISHLTRFAIVAAADITPPDAPMGATISSGANGIILSWKNPAADFGYIKIYRSEAPGNLGKLILNNITEAKVTDTDVLRGNRYYYTVRTVDPAGNESTNIEQVSAVAVGAPPKQAPTTPLYRTLQMGSAGEDVKTLQKLLNSLGFIVAPSGAGSLGNESIYFGNLTKLAVTKLQERYADELLRPAGLVSGTGIVGPATRGKLNALLQVTSLSEKKPEAPGLQVAKEALERNLSLGISGIDVASLQELLAKEGVYPEGIISGYFGNLTKAAVIKFQEKYRAEVLDPVGLSSGTGYVGTATRMKMNALLKAP